MADIIVSTSGTSGLAKDIVLTPEIMAARVAITDKANGKNIADCKVLIVAKATMSSSFQRYKAWADAKGKKIITDVTLNKVVEVIKNEKVDAIIAGPGYLVAVAKEFEKLGHSANLKQAVSGHSAMPRLSALYIQKWLSKDLQVGYGCTEIGTVCSGTAEEVAEAEGCVGKPVDGVTVEIVDGDVIRIKSPTTMVTKYEDYAEMDAIYFKDGWFYPGDKGYFTKSGKLVITETR
jgi:long-subunit acyl-CoA synthetase (AMP-forming)